MMHRATAEGTMRLSVVWGVVYWDSPERAAICVDRAAAVRGSEGSACISDGLEGYRLPRGGMLAWRWQTNDNQRANCENNKQQMATLLQESSPRPDEKCQCRHRCGWKLQVQHIAKLQRPHAIEANLQKANHEARRRSWGRPGEVLAVPYPRSIQSFGTRPTPRSTDTARRLVAPERYFASREPCSSVWYLEFSSASNRTLHDDLASCHTI